MARTTKLTTGEREWCRGLWLRLPSFPRLQDIETILDLLNGNRQVTEEVCVRASQASLPLIVFIKLIEESKKQNEHPFSTGVRPDPAH